MKSARLIIVLMAIALVGVFASSMVAQQQEQQAIRVEGDVGAVNEQENTIILVTKEGRLVTVNVNFATKIQAFKAAKGNFVDIDLGAPARVEYMQKGEEKWATSITYIDSKATKAIQFKAPGKKAAAD